MNFSGSSPVWASLLELAIVVIGGAVLLGSGHWLANQFTFNRKQRFVADVTANVSPQLARIETKIDANNASLQQKIDANNADTASIKERLARLEADQFGGNHGGLREAVNNIGAAVHDQGIAQARLEERVTELQDRR